MNLYSLSLTPMSIKCKSSSFKIELINTSVGWLMSDEVFYKKTIELQYENILEIIATLTE